MSQPYTLDGQVLMRCPACEGSFWVDLQLEDVDDHFGGHIVGVIPEDAPCPACDEQGEPVEA